MAPPEQSPPSTARAGGSRRLKLACHSACNRRRRIRALLNRRARLVDPGRLQIPSVPRASARIAERLSASNPGRSRQAHPILFQEDLQRLRSKKVRVYLKHLHQTVKRRSSACRRAPWGRSRPCSRKSARTTISVSSPSENSNGHHTLRQRRLVQRGHRLLKSVCSIPIALRLVRRTKPPSRPRRENAARQNSDDARGTTVASDGGKALRPADPTPQIPLAADAIVGQTRPTGLTARSPLSASAQRAQHDRSKAAPAAAQYDISSTSTAAKRGRPRPTRVRAGCESVNAGGSNPKEAPSTQLSRGLTWRGSRR